MKDSSCHNRPSQYYCTAGNGMEQFLAAEVQCKLAANDVDHVTGKVFFTTCADIRKVAGLKSAERLFLLLRRAPPLSWTGRTGRAEDVIQAEIIGQQQLWAERLSQWQRLRRALEGTEPGPERPGRGRKRKLEQGEGAEDGPLSGGLELGEGPGPAGVEERSTEQKRCGLGDEGRDFEEEGQGHGVERRDCGVEGRSSGVERRDSGEKRQGLEVKGCGLGEEGLGLGVEWRGLGVKGCGLGEEGLGLGVEWRGLGVKGCGFGGEGPASGTERRDSAVETAVIGACRMEAPPVSECSSGEGRVPEPQPAPVTFRVCCRCSGSIARMFRCQDLGRVIGVALSKQLGWSVNLRDPDLEVNVHLSDDHSVLGLPLLRSPLASRSYIRTTGLRSTVAWAMASLAEIKPGFCVLDPMCGVGTVLLEAAKEFPNSLFLGMDIDESQLEKAGDNVHFAQLAERVQLIKSSVMGTNIFFGLFCDYMF